MAATAKHADDVLRATRRTQNLEQ